MIRQFYSLCLNGCQNIGLDGKVHLEHLLEYLVLSMGALHGADMSVFVPTLRKNINELLAGGCKGGCQKRIRGPRSKRGCPPPPIHEINFDTKKVSGLGG